MNLQQAISTLESAGYRIVRRRASTPSARCQQAVIQDWFGPNRFGSYDAIAAKHGLTKGQVAGLVHRERLARAEPSA